MMTDERGGKRNYFVFVATDRELVGPRRNVRDSAYLGRALLAGKWYVIV